MRKNRKSKIQNRKCLLCLGTRASPLALTQSRSIARMLRKVHRGLCVELVEITTTGDKVRHKPLQEFGGTGVFVKELETALLDRRIDLAVHSLKDLPTRQPRGLAIGAIVGREDTRDVAALRHYATLADLPPGSVIGTGSPRRKAQLKACYPNLEFAEIRGNVETRLRKVQEGQYAGTILACAGLKRLGLLAPHKHEPQINADTADERRRTEDQSVRTHLCSSASICGEKVGMSMQILPHSVMLPAPGQGALAIECRAGDRRTRRFLQAIHSKEVSACVTAERAALQTLGGGCHLPLGALGETKGNTLHLCAVLGLPDGTASVRAEGSMPVAKARELGRKVARAILAQGGRALLGKLMEPQMNADARG